MHCPPRSSASSALRLLAPASLSLIAIACGSGPGPQPSAEHPNLLLISVDSLRADHVSAYGYESPFAAGTRTMPAVERLAAEGLLFEQAASSTCWTLPAHMTLMTGLPSALHGVTDNRRKLDPAITTLAESLANRGYQTAGFYSGPNLHPAFGFGAGFSTYENCSGKVLPSGAFEEALTGGDNSELVSLHQDSHSGLSSGNLLRQSSTWLEEAAAKDEPFFLFVHWWDPHYDYTPPAKLAHDFDPNYRGKKDGHDFLSLRTKPQQRDMDHILALYDAEIRHTDNHIGQLLEKLDSLGLADDTLVVFTADHGDEFFEHGYRGHQRTLYEEAVHIPLVMRMPGVLPEGQRVVGTAGLQNVFSTISDLLNVPAPNYGLGPSLRTLWENGDESRTHYMELDLPARGIQLSAVRQGDTKVIWDRVGQSMEVFDLVSDPGEQSPLVAKAPFDGPGIDGELAAAIGLIRGQVQRVESLRGGLPRTDGFLGDHELSPELADELSSFGYLGDGTEDE